MEGSKPLARFRLSRSGTHLQRLEEEYVRVVNLVDAIETHLATQARQSERMARSLDRLADSLSHVPEASKKELEWLATISESVATSAACAQRTEDGLQQLPRIADAQREGMVSIGRHLDTWQQTNERVAGSMGGVQDAVVKLGEATKTSTKHLQEMRWDTAERADRVAGLLEKQTKRLALYAWAAIALATVATAVGLAALFN